jgi:hypothetical protein
MLLTNLKSCLLSKLIFCYSINRSACIFFWETYLFEGLTFAWWHILIGEKFLVDLIGICNITMPIQEEHFSLILISFICSSTKSMEASAFVIEQVYKIIIIYTHNQIIIIIKIINTWIKTLKRNKASRNYCLYWWFQRFSLYETGQQHDYIITLLSLKVENILKYEILHIFQANHIKKLQFDYIHICGVYGKEPIL